ncbi:Phosphomevalonate kinase [Terfezia boudieri ATCC MYA-4762]|uniref:Phosphomevalonate kinase n=1 Tax=Terfezia boudieri ATCC MYA-4762 TaxID=1051890 RepID=A0A3N4LCH3_9PEZI|nr:Phosphomevalonate kinase [Terfezia boudieri ATCC MYA-4762]
MHLTPSAVSSPGKVLLAGGYLVLDRAYSGLVFALSSRIHVTSAPLKDHPEGTISVESPQFKNAHWAYQINKNLDGAGVVVAQVEHEGSSENTFVETTIRYCLNYLSMMQQDAPYFFPSIKLTILADNDYYSQPKSATPLPRFNKLGVPIFEAHKTGLGSSAALVTSLTACLLSTYSKDGTPLELTSEKNLKLVHNLAQASHCAAQGKIGSGFDVAAAVFGSCVYHRFSPALLEPLQSTEEAEHDPNHFAPKLAAIVLSNWDYSVKKTKVPPGLRVVMGDVDCGSSTPGMVRHVLAWRKEKGQVANAIWDSIEEQNQGLINMFAELSLAADEEQDDYITTLHTLAVTKGPFNAVQGSGNVVIQVLRQLRNKILSIRKSIRDMGEAAGVPIEPPSQTKLLDYLSDECSGVVGGVVPGAGGYDAVALLVVDNEDVINGIKEKLKDYKFEGEQGDQGRVEIMGAREEHVGLKVEDREQYELL